MTESTYASLFIGQIKMLACLLAFQLYGPGAVFYKLSTVCLETNAGKYVYSVCPFGPVKQTEHGRLAVVIGSRAKWLDRGPSVYRLLLDDGDSTNCPAGQHRQTTVCVLAFVLIAVDNHCRLKALY